MIGRRQLLSGAVAAAGAALVPPGLSRAQAFPAGVLAEIPSAIEAGVRTFDFTAQEFASPLLGRAMPTPFWSYTEGVLPLMRVARGEALRIRLGNRLSEHTSIHWHGIRVPNAMDGVPFVTQKPVYPGESFVYEFTPPDAGTYFFHPHCNEADQVGRGLAGLLIVTGDETEPFDDDIPVVVKDWRVDAEGQFLAAYTPKGASGAGTFGNIRSVNGVSQYRRSVPAQGFVRVRIANIDPTRIIEVGVEGADAQIIAIDGNAIEPFSLDTWRMGPAMRLDLAIASPKPGAIARVIDYAQAELFTLAELHSDNRIAPARKASPRLAPSPIPAPALANAIPQSYVFGAASGPLETYIESLDPNDPLTKVILDTLCAGPQTFWAINKHSWPNDGHRNLPPPLAKLAAGKTYRFTLQNATPQSHPIHLHGHTFKVLSASKRAMPVHYADTVLVAPKERVEIAFVATPGDWMFHCHILEHLETGMMGYFRVT
jgi:FtsP/CotA-like multicopper oxidase with cupredoxin domain